MKNSIDVLMPVYNGEKTIIKAIKSVLKQTKVNVQSIIVIDDGSTDKTCNLINALKIRNLKLIKTKNQGVSAARNYGLKFVHSDWVAFLDCDDEWSKDKLYKQISIGNKHNIGFICSSIDNVNKRYSRIININSLFAGNFIATSSVLLKFSNYSSCLPLFDAKKTFAEDYAAWIKILIFSDGYYISEQLVKYSISNTPNYHFFQSMAGLLKLYLFSYNQIFKTNWNIFRKIKTFICIVIGISRSILSSILRYFKSY